MIGLFLGLSLFSSALDNISTAEDYMNKKNFAPAVVLLEQAMKSGELNDFAKTITYWNLYKSYEGLNNEDMAAESLMSFILNSEELIEFAKTNHRPDNPANLFVRQLKLKSRVDYAKVILEVYWMRKQPSNCRTEMNYCILPKKSFMSLYLAKVPFCGNAKAILDLNQINTNGLLNINVICPNGIENYYFK